MSKNDYTEGFTNARQHHGLFPYEFCDNHFETQSPRLDISVTKLYGDITQNLEIFVSNAGNNASFK